MEGTLETPSLLHLTSEDYTKIYEPAEDSFLLIDALEQDLMHILNLKPSMCMEVGSGSGVVISALAKALGPKSYFLATDINETACYKTCDTGFYNGVNIDVINTDLVNGIYCCGQVDILIFNPPYVVTSSEEVHGKTVDGDLTRAWAGGKNGREVMNRLFPAVPSLLSPQGVFYLLVIEENNPLEIADLMKEHGFSMSVVKERRIRGEYLHVLRFERTKNGLEFSC
ncbi:methyltransferase N6AMT1 [Anabrus simplex]|uniref:methyltransferase N6AMT1 n=1 Tax=Anabrus simplex TaxID=316456 RepID=UPI0034DD0F30